MANVTDAAAVKWSNEVVRPIADHLATAVHLMDSALLDAGPNAKNMAAAFPADPAAMVDDGSLPGGSFSAAADGRTPISGADVTAFLTLCLRLQQMADNDQDPTTGVHTGVTSRMLLHKVAVNPGA